MASAPLAHLTQTSFLRPLSADLWNKCVSRQRGHSLLRAEFDIVVNHPALLLLLGLPVARVFGFLCLLRLDARLGHADQLVDVVAHAAGRTTLRLPVACLGRSLRQTSRPESVAWRSGR